MINRWRTWGLWLIAVFTLLNFAAADENREQSRYFLIVNLYSQDAYDLTAEQIAKFKSEFPNSALMDRIEFIEARSQQEENQFSQAQALYESLLKQYPQSRLRDKAFFFLGEVQFRKGDFSAALATFQRLQQDYPQSIFWFDALYWIGETFFAQGKMAEAQQAFERYLNDAPLGHYREDARYSRAWCAFNSGRFSEAAGLFASWINDYPQSKRRTQARFNQALSLYKDGKAADAQKIFSELMAQETASSLWIRAVFYQAECAYKLGDFALAEKSYQTVLDKGISGALGESAYYGLGFAQAAELHLTDALKTLNQFIVKFPDSSLARSVCYKKGLLLEQTGDWVGAQKVYLDLISTTNGSSSFFEASQLGLVRLSFVQKRWSDTLEMATRYLNRNPKGQYRDAVWLMQGDAFFQQKQYDDAKSSFQHVVDEFPQGSSTLEALYKIGLCENYAGNPEKAKAAFETVLNRFAENPYRAETLFALAELSLRLNAPDDAMGYYQSVLEVPDVSTSLKAKSLYGLGWAAFKKADYPKAIASFNQLQVDFPSSTWNLTVTFKKAEAYWNLKQFSNAEKEFLSLIPSTAFSADARYYLAQIYAKTGEFSKAVKTLQTVAEQSTDPRLRGKAWMEIGWNDYRMENYQDAYLYFGKVIEKLPSVNADLISEATLRQADCLYNLRRFQEAGDRYQRAFQIPNTRFAKDALYGNFLSVLQQNNFSRAKEIWKQFSLLYPQDPLVLDMDQKINERQNQ